MLGYVTIVGAAVLVLSYFLAKVGLDLKGTTLVAQELPIADLAWRYLSYVWGYALMGIILAVIIRGLVGSIVAFFLIPTMESTLGLLLKENAQYLPFRSLDSIPSSSQPGSITAGYDMLSSKAGLAVFSVYLVILGSIAVVSFVKRDAN